MSDGRDFGDGYEQKEQKNNVSFKEQRALVNAMAHKLETTLRSFDGLVITNANIMLIEITIIRALQELMPNCSSMIKFDTAVVGGKNKTMLLIPMNGFTTALFNSLTSL